MQDPGDIAVSIAQPEPESVLRLLAALGEWGEAEVQGASMLILEQLAGRALSAYEDIAAVA